MSGGVDVIISSKTPEKRGSDNIVRHSKTRGQQDGEYEYNMSVNKTTF